MDSLEDISPPPPPEKKDYWNELLTGLFLFFIFYFIGQGIAGVCISLFGWQSRFEGFSTGRLDDPESAMIFRFVQGIFAFSWFFFPIMIWAGTRGKPFEILKLNRGSNAPLFFLAACVMIVSIPAISYLVITPERFSASPEFSEALKKLEAESSKITVSLLSDTTARGLASNLFFLCLVPAFVEEVLFRGFFQRTMGKIFNIHVAILITATLFSLMHGQLLVFLPRVILGIFLGYFFVKTGSLWVNIFAHFSYNAASVVLGYLTVNGTLPESLMDDTFPYPLWILGLSVILTAGLFYFFMKKTKIQKETNE